MLPIVVVQKEKLQVTGHPAVVHLGNQKRALGIDPGRHLQGVTDHQPISGIDGQFRHHRLQSTHTGYYLNLNAGLPGPFQEQGDGGFRDKGMSRNGVDYRGFPRSSKQLIDNLLVDLGELLRGLIDVIEGVNGTGNLLDQLWNQGMNSGTKVNGNIGHQLGLGSQGNQIGRAGA